MLSPLAFVVANFLILWSGWTTDYKLGIAILIGYVILALNHVLKLNPTRPQFELRSAVWLPVYLVGMGLIVYLSDFGPLANPWFPLWWDMVAVAVFSLAIYFWARRVALPRDKIEALIGASAVALDAEDAVHPENGAGDDEAGGQHARTPAQRAAAGPVGGHARERCEHDDADDQRRDADERGAVGAGREREDHERGARDERDRDRDQRRPPAREAPARGTVVAAADRRRR